jgi:glycosyltransferase involved in cell wall biosynthesis
MSDLKPLVTVFIPVYNAELYLNETIDSILNQTFIDFELLAIDDGSTDRSLAILNSYDDPRIRIERNDKNKGRPYTRNRGVQLASGEYFAVLDADDLAEKNRLEIQVSYLNIHKSIAAVGSYATIISDSGKQLSTVEVPTDSKEIKRMIFHVNCFVHSSVMFRTKALINVGAYNLAYPQAQDYELFLRLCHKHELANIPIALVRYRIHSAQVSQTSLSGQRKLADKARLTMFNTQQELGELPDNVIIPRADIIAKLKGLPSTLGADYLGWADSYRKLGARPNEYALIVSAIKAAPLCKQAYMRLFQLMPFAPTIRWYKKKLLALLRAPNK